MIDQAHIVIKHRRGKNGWTPDFKDRLHGLGIDEFKVINFQVLGFGQPFSGMAKDFIGLVKFCRLIERAKNA
jgi:hypothetical protein